MRAHAASEDSQGESTILHVSTQSDILAHRLSLHAPCMARLHALSIESSPSSGIGARNLAGNAYTDALCPSKPGFGCIQSRPLRPVSASRWLLESYPGILDSSTLGIDVS